jgi:hypothetical protein
MVAHPDRLDDVVVTAALLVAQKLVALDQDAVGIGVRSVVVVRQIVS